jgi:hypothetical protein
VNLILILGVACLLGAIITYGILIDWKWLREVGAAGARAARPDVPERQIQHAAAIAARKVSLRTAAFWPLILAFLVVVALTDAAIRK